ncbi:E3 ubiquitin/ISG15 ligase TRIM25-like isoform X2 [Scophthalmus maximus]|uniref:E3 ubiquitin/ISG15 ligase TRIM25-like isoform X2 n=1 Tax=Scophthalmus maximus TaxID=52904 RepID=UPI001FA86138|nr:E3 ubiquitin/ISG15 ligase TRIM25-like isoform X2 [Scophthalmus maximus]
MPCSVCTDYRCQTLQNFTGDEWRMEDSEKTHLGRMLMCTVCRDIFKDPRQLPCGHSMCAGCLENMMGHATDSPFRCPDCRTSFGPSIEVRLQKNYALANITEDFRESRRRREQTKSVYCDCCPGKKALATQTCLKCEVSMCTEHVEGHLELPAFTGHPLVRPLGDLQERKCPQHGGEVPRYYCNTSRRYICNMCALESKQQNIATEASTALRRQMIEYMDQRLTALEQQITGSTDSVRRLKEDIQRERLKLIPADLCLNSVTVVLLCLWFIVLYYAYNYFVENLTLRETLDKQQNYAHHICSSIAEILVKHPMTSHTPAEDECTKDQSVGNKASEWKC